LVTAIFLQYKTIKENIKELGYDIGFIKNDELSISNESTGTVKCNEKEENKNEINGIVAGKEDEKNKIFFSNFGKDENKWEGLGDRFERKEYNENIFKPILTENFPEGREIFSYEKFSPNFKLSFDFLPLNEKKINLSIGYGYLWRIIIGSGDYNQIQIQINSRYPYPAKKSDDWKTECKSWIKRNVGLKPINQMAIILNSQPDKSNPNNILLNGTIKGILKNDSQETVPIETCKLPLPKPNDVLNEEISIGILDSREEGIEIKFNEFKLELSNIN